MGDQRAHLTSRVHNPRGPAHDVGYPVTLVKGCDALGEQPVGPHIIAMVGAKEHQGVLCLTGGIQRFQHQAQQVILHGAIAPVMGDRLAVLTLAQLVPHPALALIDAGLVPQIIAPVRRQVHLIGVIHRRIVLRDYEGIVRAVGADIETPGASAGGQVLQGPQTVLDDPVVTCGKGGGLGRRLSSAVELQPAPAGPQDLAAAPRRIRLGTLCALAPALPGHAVIVAPADGRGAVIDPAAVRRSLIGADVPLSRIRQGITCLGQDLAP